MILCHSVANKQSLGRKKTKKGSVLAIMMMVHALAVPSAWAEDFETRMRAIQSTLDKGLVEENPQLVSEGLVKLQNEKPSPDSENYDAWVKFVKEVDAKLVRFKITSRETTVVEVKGATPTQTVTRKIIESASQDCNRSLHTISFFGLYYKPCNFGIAVPGITAIAGRGSRSYVTKAQVNGLGIVQVMERSSYKPLTFLSATAYYKWANSDVPFFWGIPVGVGLDKQAASSPPLMWGFSAGLVIDDTKFFAVTYGEFYDPGTTRIAFPFYEGAPNPITGLTTLNATSLTQNGLISVPLEKVRGIYRGLGFSFNYKF